MTDRQGSRPKKVPKRSASPPRDFTPGEDAAMELRLKGFSASHIFGDLHRAERLDAGARALVELWLQEEQAAAMRHNQLNQRDSLAIAALRPKRRGARKDADPFIRGRYFVVSTDPRVSSDQLWCNFHLLRKWMLDGAQIKWRQMWDHLGQILMGAGEAGLKASWTPSEPWHTYFQTDNGDRLEYRPLHVPAKGRVVFACAGDFGIVHEFDEGQPLPADAMIEWAESWIMARERQILHVGEFDSAKPVHTVADPEGQDDLHVATEQDRRTKQAMEKFDRKQTIERNLQAGRDAESLRDLLSRPLSAVSAVEQLRAMADLIPGEVTPKVYDAAASIVVRMSRLGLFKQYALAYRYLCAHDAGVIPPSLVGWWGDFSAAIRKDKGLPKKDMFSAFPEDARLAAEIVAAGTAEGTLAGPPLPPNGPGKRSRAAAITAIDDALFTVTVRRKVLQLMPDQFGLFRRVVAGKGAIVSLSKNSNIKRPDKVMGRIPGPLAVLIGRRRGAGGGYWLDPAHFAPGVA